MHRKKISVRLVMNLAFIAVAIITAVIVNFYPLIYAENLAFLSGESYVLRFSRDISEKISGFSVVDTQSLAGFCDSLTGIGGRRLIVTDENGRVLCDNASASDKTGLYLLSGDILSALDGEIIYHSRYSDGAFYSFAVVPFSFQESTAGAVCFFDTNTELGAEIRAIQKKLFLISLIPCALFIGTSILLSDRFSRMFRRILAGIGRLKSGHYSDKIDLSGMGEFREIADSLDSLGETLRESHEMTRRFVSDASHELKTPLATIKLLSDSIIQTSKISTQDVREFLLDINEEIDRLTRISGRLLQISRLEDPADFAESEILDLKPIAESVCRRLAPLAAAANCTIRCELSDGCVIRADYDNVYQIFYNLIENAIKYSGQDNAVKVLLFLRGNEVVFIVDDNGEGIPEQDLKKIFERFYRVDKARARATGGTGLGLSIVASAVEQCKGSVTAENRPGGGARFTVKFPKSDQPLPERREFE